jgi:hypothetical protein
MPVHLPLKKDTDKYSRQSASRLTNDTSPVQILNVTASKMSQSFIGIFKGVGDTLQSVQEGRKANNKSRVPPWGAAADEQSWELKGSERMSKSTGSTDESVDSAQEVSPTFVPSPTKISAELTTTEAEQACGKIDQMLPSETGSNEIESPELKDPPPLVRLDGDQLTVIKIEHRHSKSSQNKDKPRSSDIGTAAVSCLGTKELGAFPSRHRTFEAVGEDEYEELVYSRKTKKLKKKKLKPGGI